MKRILEDEKDLKDLLADGPSIWGFLHEFWPYVKRGEKTKEEIVELFKLFAEAHVGLYEEYKKYKLTKRGE